MLDVDIDVDDVSIDDFFLDIFVYLFVCLVRIPTHSIERTKNQNQLCKLWSGKIGSNIRRVLSVYCMK